MAGEPPTEAQLPRPHIIKRPRLTNLLDQTRAETILLVAPAGYGKTTLAREWLRGKPHFWYRAGPSSRDIASLAIGLAAAISRDDGLVDQMRRRLAVVDDPSAAIPKLTDILAREVARLGGQNILVVDDYDSLAPNATAEQFLVALTAESKMRLFVTARTRPQWATAKRILYGEIFELTQATLAMDPEEAAAVLARRPGAALPGLGTLAQGWPAVLGLAALTGETPPSDGLPDQLYEFFADELYRQVPERLRGPLARLAFVTAIDEEVTRLVFGPDAPELIELAVRIGFLTRTSGGELSTHPLVQAFLKKRALAMAPGSREVALEVADAFLRAGRWDEAFGVIEAMELHEILEPLLALALPEMVQTGRTVTLERWAAFGTSGPGNGPTIDLVKAELALRHGAYHAAESLALTAHGKFDLDHKLRPRTLLVAGKAAHLADEEQRGFDYYSEAREVAKTPEDQREAVWGQLICANQLDLPIVTELCAILSAFAPASPDETLRLATMQYVVGLRSDGIATALPRLRSAYELFNEASDPLARTSFLNIFARGLALSGSYDEAAVMADRLMMEAHESRLAFVRPHGLVAKAMAELGGHRPAAALSLLDEADALTARGSDLHSQLDSQAVRCRVYVSTKRFDAALRVTAMQPHPAGATARSEFLLSRALALLGANRRDEAVALMTQAGGHNGVAFRSHEVRGLARWVEAVAGLKGEQPQSDAVAEALRFSVGAGVVDSFVVAYRAFPEILDVLAAHSSLRDLTTATLSRVGDTKLGNERGLGRDGPADVLSRREQEVYELLAAGRSNKEIATALFISDVTVKVHVRHILRKLGARTRTEAAVLRSTALRP